MESGKLYLSDNNFVVQNQAARWIIKFKGRSCSDRIMFSLLIWANILNSRNFAQCTSDTCDLFFERNYLSC